MVNVRFLNGLPGSGKTTKILNEIAHNPDKYIIAQPRQELIDETYDRLKPLLAQVAPLAEAVVIHSNQSPYPNIPVGSQIIDAAVTYAAREHVVLMITHESLMSNDMSVYDGWNIYIDEVPNSIKSKIVRIPAIAAYLAQIIDLEQIGTSGWSFADLNAHAPSQAHVDADTCLTAVAEVFKMMRGQRVLAFDTTSFTEMVGQTKPLDWFSYWDLSSLQKFKSITVAGASFKNSILYRVMSSDIQLTEVAVTRPRVGNVRVTVRYFTKGHRSSTWFWRTEKGQKCLDAVRDYFAAKTDSNYYWSSNTKASAVLRPGMKGTEVKPKQEGSNDLTSYPTAVFIYSSKAHPKYDKALCELAQLSKTDIEEVREQEDIKQFIMRGCIRDMNWSGDYVIYVYDEQQANVVAEYMQEVRLGRPTMELLHQAQIADVRSGKSQSSKKQGTEAKPRLSEEEKNKNAARRKREARAAERAVKQAQGIYRPPGRPKK